jgi:hypothetical protein
LPTIYRCPVKKNANLLKICPDGGLLNDIGCARDDSNAKKAGTAGEKRGGVRNKIQH